MNYVEQGSEILTVETDQTGGNVYNDIIELKDNSIVVITSDAVYYFRTRKDYELVTSDAVYYFRSRKDYELNNEVGMILRYEPNVILKRK